MLKMAAPPERLTFDRLKFDDNESGDGVDDRKIAKKSEKPNGHKLFKSQKPAKLEKKLSKSGNSLNFDTKNSGQSFLTPKARAAFNRLRLAFIKVPIL